MLIAASAQRWNVHAASNLRHSSAHQAADQCDWTASLHMMTADSPGEAGRPAE